MSTPSAPQVQIRSRAFDGALQFWWAAPASDGGSAVTGYVLSNGGSANWTWDLSGVATHFTVNDYDISGDGQAAIKSVESYTSGSLRVSLDLSSVQAVTIGIMPVGSTEFDLDGSGYQFVFFGSGYDPRSVYVQARSESYNTQFTGYERVADTYTIVYDASFVKFYADNDLLHTSPRVSPELAYRAFLSTEDPFSRIRLGRDTVQLPAGTATYRVPVLTNGTTYDYTVAAKNANGTGPAAAFRPAEPCVGPLPPTDVSATILGLGTVQISWTNPTLDPNIYGHPRLNLIRAFPSDMSAPILLCTYFNETSRVFQGLDTNLAYNFLVQAQSGAGNAPATAFSGPVSFGGGPADISGLVLWLDSMDNTVLFSDLAATTPATAGGPVRAWRDKSANQRLFKAASESFFASVTAPILDTGSVYFTQATDALGTDWTDACGEYQPFTSEETTIFIVAQASNDASFNSIITPIFGARAGYETDKPYWTVIPTNGATGKGVEFYQTLAYQWGYPVVSTMLNNKIDMFTNKNCIVAYTDVSNMTQYIVNAPAPQASTSGNLSRNEWTQARSTLPANTISVNDYWYLSDPSGVDVKNLRIYDIIGYNRKLSYEERQQVQGYLQVKYPFFVPDISNELFIRPAESSNNSGFFLPDLSANFYVYRDASGSYTFNRSQWIDTDASAVLLNDSWSLERAFTTPGVFNHRYKLLTHDNSGTGFTRDISGIVVKKPTDISGLKLWLDSAQSDTIFQDVSGTNPIDPLDTTLASVRRWNDKSGNGNDFFIQTYNGVNYSPPDYRAYDGTGPRIIFDISMQRLATDVNNQVCLTPSNTTTIYIMANVESAFVVAYSPSSIFRNTDASGNHTISLQQTPADNTSITSRIGHTPARLNGFEGDYAGNRLSLIVIRADASGSCTYTVNPNSYELTVARDLSDITLDSYYELGAEDLERTQRLEIFQVLVYDGAHSEADRRDVLQYLVSVARSPVRYRNLYFPYASELYPYADTGVSIGITIGTDASGSVAVDDRLAPSAVLTSASNNTLFQFFKSQWQVNDVSGATNTHSFSYTADSSGTKVFDYTATTLAGKEIKGRTGVIVDGLIEVMLGGQVLKPVSQLAVSSDATRFFNLSETNMRGVSGYFVIVYAVAWNGRMWLAGGGNGFSNIFLIQSYDGVNWIPVVLEQPSTILTILWTGSQWLVGGDYLQYSLDGFNWATASVPIAAIVKLATNGTWILAGGRRGGGTTTLARSQDGITWTAIQTGGYMSYQMNGMLWTGSKWAFVGEHNSSPGTLIAYTSSSDASGVYTRIQSPDGYPQAGIKIAYSGSKYMIAGTDYIATSTDLDTWSLSRPEILGGEYQERFSDVAWLGNRWMVVGGTQFYGDATNTIATSQDDGATWTGQGTSVYDSAGLAIAQRKTDTPEVRLVAGGSGSPGTLAVSGDGTRWKSLGSSIFSTQCNAVAYNDGLWIAVGQGTNTIAKSQDGINWTGLGTSIFSTAGLGIAWKSGVWVAVGSGTNTIASSTDGSGWTGHGTSIFSTQGKGVAANHLYFVAVGAGTNTIASSPDGVTWTGHGTSVFSTAGNGIATALGMWVAVGEGTNTIANATDLSGTYWNGLGTTYFNTAGYKVATNGQKWLMVGSHSASGRLVDASMNFAHVTGRGNPVGADPLYFVAWGGQFWLAGGSGSNPIRYSKDGHHWYPVLGTAPFTTGYTVAAAQPNLTFGGNNTNWIGYSYGNQGQTPGFGYVKRANTGARKRPRWAGSYWLSAGQDPQLLYSVDGVNWITPPPKNGGPALLTSANGALMCGPYIYMFGDPGVGYNSVWYNLPDLTNPGTSWSSLSDNLENGGIATGLSHDPSSNVIVATFYTGTNKLYRNTVGSSYWTNVDPGGISAYWATIFAENKFWAVGSDAPYIRKSTDGSTWIDVSGGDLSGSGGFGDIAYGNGVFVVAGRLGDNDIFYSTNGGVTWRASYRAGPVYNIFGTAVNSSAYSVAWDGSQFIASGQTTDTDPDIYSFATSPNGQVWTRLTDTNQPLTTYTGIASLGSKYNV